MKHKKFFYIKLITKLIFYHIINIKIIFILKFKIYLLILSFKMQEIATFNPPNKLELNSHIYTLKII